jgi:zinc finger protein
MKYPKPVAQAKKQILEKTLDKSPGRQEKPMLIKGELCPFCSKKTLALMESEMDIPYFGKAYLFSMNCENKDCGYHKADVESAEEAKASVKYTLEVSSEEDMKIRVVKSSTCTVKIPHIGSINPGEASNGYVTNVEGILQRMKKQVENVRDDSEVEEEERKKAKNLIKKITRVMWGQEKAKITLEDPQGNSAIISPKALKA